ncbi:MAG: shikimate dehydrogenase [Bacteroidaceae bacterium]|nr:shikimate dehydrogenase [Bacteroidaceae bacterium]
MRTTYGLIGYPLGHSFSKGYFTHFFEQEGIDAEYKNFELPSIEALPNILKEETTLRGFNVTIPYKQQVIPYLHEIDSAAATIGAVNVVKIIKQNEGNIYLKGYNTDVIGFTDSIRPLLKLHHKQALILGTGGASKAVCYALQQLGLTTQQVSRTPSENVLCYEDLTPEIMSSHTVIVNTTPLGMHPKKEECPALNYSLINTQHLLFDVIYNPEKTLFMQCGEHNGATVHNGMDMLIGQAKAAWRIWNE